MLTSHPEITQNHYIPSYMHSLALQLSIIGAAIILLFSDMQRFLQQKKRLSESIQELERERNHIWQSKKKLQERSHIYSGHADKLKRFISDKLLDYIEYDEKFLHFKNIASEVRHNGVISYDIVRTALENAAKGSTAPAPESFADTHRFGLPNNPNSDYKQALDAMKYLWDLLDLSTAENIALHIGNHLIECEEQYYQQELNTDSTSQADAAPTFKPYFSPGFAAIKTLSPLMEPNQADKVIAQLNALKTSNDDQAPHNYFHETSSFRIYLNKTETLLGNENHLILLLENLIKNAQFFTSKRKFKQKTDRIALQLNQGPNYIQYKVYNRGSHVKASDLEQIFQLGFSTRRVKEHHGKGLGLYFVKEIVNGYQGQVRVHNISNQAHTYSIKVTLINDETSSKDITTDPDQLRTSKNNQWRFDKPIARIEINHQNTQQSYIFDKLNTMDSTQLLDPENPFAPEWQMEVKVKRKEWELKFLPLDISGVEFDVKLPSAEACLNGTEPTFKEGLEQEVDDLNALFNEFDDY